MLPPGAILELKIHQNVFAAGRDFAPDCTLGELQRASLGSAVS